MNGPPQAGPAKLGRSDVSHRPPRAILRAALWVATWTFTTFPAAAQPTPRACQIDAAPPGTPDAIRLRAMNHEVAPAPSAPGLRLWVLRGRPIRDGHPQRFARLIALDERTGDVLEGVALFHRLATGTPTDMARAALSTVIWRAGQAPLTPADAATLAPRVAGSVTAPRVEGRTLIFWVRSLPGGPWAREIRVDLASGRANVGAVFT